MVLQFRYVFGICLIEDALGFNVDVVCGRAELVGEDLIKLLRLLVIILPQLLHLLYLVFLSF